MWCETSFLFPNTQNKSVGRDLGGDEHTSILLYTAKGAYFYAGCAGGILRNRRLPPVTMYNKLFATGPKEYRFSDNRRKKMLYSDCIDVPIIPRVPQPSPPRPPCCQPAPPEHRGRNGHKRGHARQATQQAKSAHNSKVQVFGVLSTSRA